MQNKKKKDDYYFFTEKVKYNRGFLLWSHQAWQLCCTEILQPPGHSMTAAVLRTSIKEMHCILIQTPHILFWE
jgi:hypothetical protein